MTSALMGTTLYALFSKLACSVLILRTFVFLLVSERVGAEVVECACVIEVPQLKVRNCGFQVYVLLVFHIYEGLVWWQEQLLSVGVMLMMCLDVTGS